MGAIIHSLNLFKIKTSWVFLGLVLQTTFAHAALSPFQIDDLLKNFNSNGKTVLFVFCREDRSFPCLSMIRLQNNNLYQEDSKTEKWSLPLLAESVERKAYYEVEGNTPQGIFKINGVMPFADNFEDFGKFRRLILDFLSPDSNDEESMKMIPSNLLALPWWHEASVARDMGRRLFRIHGVGIENLYPRSHEYPFVPTWGCLTTREGLVGGVQFQDQRIMLDSLMIAQGLTPSDQNELLIQSYAVVIDINDVRLPVELNDILRL